MDATIKDIAARAGVSISTVHYALRGTRPIREATRERVLAAVRDLDYQPHSSAATLPSGRTGRLAVVIAGLEPAFANTYFSDYVRGLAAAAEARDYTVVLYTAYRRRADEGWRPAHILRRREADGIVLLGTQIPRGHLDELAERDAPCVLLNREHPGLPSINADRRQGAAGATAHLLALGRHPLALFGGDFPGGGPAQERPELAGFLDAHRAAGRETDLSLARFAPAPGRARARRRRAPGPAGEGPGRRRAPGPGALQLHPGRRGLPGHRRVRAGRPGGPGAGGGGRGQRAPGAPGRTADHSAGPQVRDG